MLKGLFCLRNQELRNGQGWNRPMGSTYRQSVFEARTTHSAQSYHDAP